MTNIPALDTPWSVCADLYDLEFDGWTSQDLPFYLHEASQNPPLLELACGTGRLAIPIAQSGVPVVGLDVSSKMLEEAHQKAGSLSNLQLVHGRMETFELPQQFGLIILAFASFYALDSVEAQEETLHNIRRHLKPGGKLIMDMFLPSEAYLGKPLRSGDIGDDARLVARLLDPHTGYAHLVWEAAHHMPNDQVYEISRIVQTFDATGQSTGEARHFQITGHYVHRYEMQHLLRLCGYEIIGLYGDFNYAPFNASSTRMVWIARPNDHQSTTPSLQKS